MPNKVTEPIVDHSKEIKKNREFDEDFDEDVLLKELVGTESQDDLLRGFLNSTNASTNNDSGIFG